MTSSRASAFPECMYRENYCVHRRARRASVRFFERARGLNGSVRGETLEDLHTGYRVVRHMLAYRASVSAYTRATTRFCAGGQARGTHK